MSVWGLSLPGVLPGPACSSAYVLLHCIEQGAAQNTSGMYNRHQFRGVGAL